VRNLKVIIDDKEFVEKTEQKDWNSGDGNSGYWNSGDRNSGDGNSGYRNSGYWNSGDGNSGYCNFGMPTVIMFNKDTKISYDKFQADFPDYFYFVLTDWITIGNMTDAEKKEYPHYAVTEGFLRVYKYKQAWKNSFEKASKEDVAKTLKLPNFDYSIFAKISGITKTMIDKKLKGKG
jgi:hypothetical protein